MRFLSNSIRIIGFGALISGASLAAQALVALAGAAVAVAGSLSRLAGVAAALPGLLSAVAQGISSILFATAGIGGALKAMGQAGISGGGGAASGAKQAAAALKRQEAAAERVADATRSLERTERDAARSVARAQERVAEAKENLADVAEDSAEDMAAAAERVQDAEEDLARAQEDAADRIKDAKRRVEDAAEDLAAAEADAADRIADATERVEDAKRSLARTQRDAQRAQEDLTRARERATQRLEDLQLRTRQLSVDERQAARSVARAQALLDANRGADPARRQILIDQLEEEQIRLERIRLEQQRAGEEMEEFNENGIDGAEEVVSAEERLRQQLERVAEAERNVQKAAEARAKAQLQALDRIADAQDRLSRAQELSARAQRDATRRVADAQERLAEAHQRVADAQEDAADRMADAEKALQRAREDAAEAQLDAQERVADAQRALERAIRDSQRAAEDFGSAGGGGIDKVAQAMANLPKSAQDFVRFLFSLKPLLDELRKTAADNLFPGLTQAIKLTLPLFPIFRDAIGQTAKAIADLSIEGAKLISSPVFVGDLRRLADQNVRTIKQFGTASINLTDALRNVSVAAIPLTNHIGELAVKFSQNIREAAALGRESGRLGKFFERVAKTLDTVIDIGGNLIATFINIGSAGSKLGDDLLESFAEITQGWQDFTGSVEGQNELKKFFDDVRPVISEIGGLIRAVGQALIDLSRDPDTAAFIKSLREEFLPVLKEMFQAAADLGPNFLDLFKSLAGLLAELATTPGMGLFITSLARLAEALDKLLEKVPLLKELVGVFIAIQAAAGLGGLAKMAGNFFKASAAMGVFLAAIGSVRAILPLLAASLGLPLGPMLAIGAAVGVLAVVVIKNWDTIKTKTVEIWNNITEFLSQTWETIKAKSAEIWETLTGFLSTKWEEAKGKTREIWNGIKTFLLGIWNSIKTTVSSTIDGLRQNISNRWESIKRTTSSVWNNIKQTVSTAITSARNTVSNIIGNILTNIGNAWNDARNRTSQAWEDIKRAVTDKIGGVLHEVGNLPGRILNALGNLGSLLWNAGQDLVQGLIDGVRSMGRALINAILRLIPGPVRGVVQRALGISSPSKVFKGFGVNIMQGLIVGLEDQRRTLRQRLESLADDIRETQFGASISVGPDGQVRAGNGSAIGGSGISVRGGLTVNIRGVLDPTDPLAVRRMIQQLEAELRKLQEEKA